MITNDDLRIENISYTNKDFAQIYPELIDLVKTLTDKWDPELTNESDPGIVLLKLAAFIGDKNNYNIDKNILEQFVTSVTQEINARRIYDTLGYNMKYYNSATAKLSFKYLGGNDTIDAGNNNYKIKAFDTTVKTEDNIIYTLLTDINFNKTNPMQNNIELIQGQLTCLNISSTSADADNSIKIQLYNLDDNNRVYFPDRYVAENGIFINKIYSNINSDAYWKKVDNLNDVDAGTKCYKFGFDSNRGLPYIEFPSDIPELIGDGIEVWYIITDGINGYAKNGSLTSFDSIKVVDSTTNTSFTEDFDYVLGNTEAIGARNPETLTEAYNNFKKTIGTFNTLVSRRDYSNGIYNYEDSMNNHLVSAIEVTDVKSDPNTSKTVLTRDENGVSYYNTTVADGINYNTIILHGTNPVNTEIKTQSSYNLTYNPLTAEQIREIDSSLDDYKTLTHILKSPASLSGSGISVDKLGMIQNKYQLKVNITTTYKVNDYENSVIINNVKKALYNAFNARKVDFGEEIPYDSIIDIIQQADTRIKYVFIENPTINPYIITQSGTNFEEHAFNPTTTDKYMVIDNILAGRIEYYINDKKFSYDYNQSGLGSYADIQTISANYTLSANTETTLSANESIQVLQDSYISDITYPAYVYYSLATTTSSIPANSVYKLTGLDTLYIYYTDSSDVKQFITYSAGTCIRANFDLCDTLTGETSQGAGSNKSASRWGDFTNKVIYTNSQTGTIPLYALGSDETIDHVVLNSTTLSANQQNCFWYVKPTADNLDGNLVFDENNQYILEEGEFFIYPNDDMTSICVLSSGTKLTHDGDLIKSANYAIDITELNDSVDSGDIYTFEQSFKWETKDFSTDNFVITEQNINVFVEGDKVTSTVSLSSAWTTLSSGDSITSGGSEIDYSNIAETKARTVLSINGSSSTPQKVLPNESILIIYSSGSLSTTLSTGSLFQIYPAIDSYNNIYLGSFTLSETLSGYLEDTESISYPYSLLKYTELENPTNTDLLYYIGSGNKNSRNEYYITFSETTSIDLPQAANADTYVSIFDPLELDTTLITLSTSSTTSHTFSAGSYYVSTPQELSINETLSGLSIASTDLDESFDYLAPLNTAKLISTYDTFRANWFFDKNNIYNNLTISKIDFDNSEFKIVGVSRR